MSSEDRLLNCPDCHGKGERRTTCTLCSGTGRETCWTCQGRGYAPGYGGPGTIDMSSPCPDCHGHGERQSCDECAGRGFVWDDCQTCCATGYVTETEAREIIARRKEERRLADERARRAAEAKSEAEAAEAPLRQARAEAERERLAAESEAWRRAVAEERSRIIEERRRETLMKQRRTLGKCVFCGRPLGFRAKIAGDIKHRDCHEFKDHFEA